MRFLALLLAVTTVATVCNSARGDQRPRPAGIREDDPRVVAFVSYLDQHGIKLAHKEANWWRVTGPRSSRYSILVALRGFPQEATEEQMKAEARLISLRFRLNPAAHLGMSLSMQTRTPKDVPRFTPDNSRVGRRLIRLFDAYRPVRWRRRPEGRAS